LRIAVGADQDLAAVDGGRSRQSRARLRTWSLGTVASCPGGRDDRSAIGCSERASTAAMRLRTSRCRSPGAVTKSVSSGLPLVRVPVLSRRRHRPRAGLQRLALAEQDAEFGGAAGADHDRGRGRQAHGAGAGDDQHGHRIDQREGERAVRAETQPDGRSAGLRQSRPARTRRSPCRPAPGSAASRPAPASTMRMIWASSVSLPTLVASNVKEPVCVDRAAHDLGTADLSGPGRARR
jgi:hypothetical protein